MTQMVVVIFELAQPGQSSEKLTRLIKEQASWARISNNAYLLLTEKTPVNIRDALLSGLSIGDKIYVGMSPAPSAWYGLPEEVSKWVIANQK